MNPNTSVVAAKLADAQERLQDLNDLAKTAKQKSEQVISEEVLKYGAKLAAVEVRKTWIVWGLGCMAMIEWL